MFQNVPSEQNNTERCFWCLHIGFLEVIAALDRFPRSPRNRFRAAIGLSDLGNRFRAAIDLSDLGNRFRAAIGLSDLGNRFRAALGLSDLGNRFRAVIASIFNILHS